MDHEYLKDLEVDTLGCSEFFWSRAATKALQEIQ
jgi:hypothetical protein